MRDVVGVMRVSGGAGAAMIGGWVVGSLVMNEHRGVRGGVRCCYLLDPEGLIED